MSGRRPSASARSAFALAVVFVLAALHATGQALAGPSAGSSAAGSSAAHEGSADWYDRQAREAIEQHGYEAAAKLLQEAKRAFPDDERFSLTLASLYYDKELWRLALDEYLEAERKGQQDPDLYARIARCLGKLDRNREAVTWLERATARWPHDTGLADDLGWMYFKVHRYADGVRLLVAASAAEGMSADFAMTLGTLYAGMGDYAASSRAYRTAIELSAGKDSRTFAAIAWYNLSLLERRFYHYRAAFEATGEALAAQDLASGHLARGELLEGRMDHRGALAEYEAALALDDTPLARVSLAMLHRRFGQLEPALQYASEALAEEDSAWLLYYGSDLAHYRLDVHDALARIHEGLARVAFRRPTADPLERCRALFSAAVHALESWYHRQRARLYAAEVGRGFLAEGAEEEGALHLAAATEAYPRIALKWLGVARAAETARAPQAEPLYRIDEGKLRRSAGAIGDAIGRLDAVWERQFLAEGLIDLIPLARRAGDREGRREAINRLYAINPGALAPEGLALPLVVRFSGDWAAGERRAVRRLLARSGSELADRPGDGFRYVLTLARTGDGKVGFSLAEGDAGPPRGSGTVEPSGGPRRRAARIVAAVLAECSAVE